QGLNSGYPPMVVWYHRHAPVVMADDGSVVSPMQGDPRLLEAAAQLGRWADFLAIPCNSAHVAQAAIADAAGCPVLSMVDLVVHDVARRGWKTVGVLGFSGPPRVYLEPLAAQGIMCEAVDQERQAGLDAAIRAGMGGR